MKDNRYEICMEGWIDEIFNPKLYGIYNCQEVSILTYAKVCTPKLQLLNCMLEYLAEINKADLPNKCFCSLFQHVKSIK